MGTWVMIQKSKLYREVIVSSLANGSHISWQGPRILSTYRINMVYCKWEDYYSGGLYTVRTWHCYVWWVLDRIEVFDCGFFYKASADRDAPTPILWMLGGTASLDNLLRSCALTKKWPNPQWDTACQERPPTAPCGSLLWGTVWSPLASSIWTTPSGRL
jgi:hypothetical protein